jgi:hypothetical protein
MKYKARNKYSKKEGKNDAGRKKRTKKNKRERNEAAGCSASRLQCRRSNT